MRLRYVLALALLGIVGILLFGKGITGLVIADTSICTDCQIPAANHFNFLFGAFLVFTALGTLTYQYTSK
jgi:hypothetical protein